jgi:hypothetical protein
MLKNLALELHSRKVSQRQNTKLTGLSYYKFKFEPIKQDLTKLNIVELYQLTQKTKQEYDTIFLKLNKRYNYGRFCCSDCGTRLGVNRFYKKIGGKQYHRTAKRSYCLSCWESKFV